jgi:hypothetical protein
MGEVCSVERESDILAQNALPLSTLVPGGLHDDGYGCDGRVWRQYQPGGQPSGGCRIK